MSREKRPLEGCCVFDARNLVEATVSISGLLERARELDSEAWLPLLSDCLAAALLPRRRLFGILKRLEEVGGAVVAFDDEELGGGAFSVP